jgi:hypothetical protein
MPSVNVVYVEWGSGGRAKSLEETFNCIAAAGAELKELVVVDNRGQCARLPESPARRSIVIDGDNMARDFSGWDCGVKALTSEADVLFCVNDTFAVHRRIRPARRMRIARWINNVANSGGPEMFGQVDPFDRPIQWPFGFMSHYLCSYLFGMNRAAANLMMPLTAIDAQVEAMVRREFSSDGLYADHVSSDYRAHVERWLFTPGKWRYAQPLTEENFDFFRLKAKSVIYEHALICRAESLGITVSDLFAGRGLIDEVVAASLRAWMGASMAVYQTLPEAIKGKFRHTRQAAPGRRHLAAHETNIRG